jgi:hydantoinase/carbamoylase family amidase
VEQPRNADRAARTIERLGLLAQIGRVPGQAGTTRPGLSRLEQEAHDLVASWLEDEGFSVSVDDAGNLYGRLEGSDVDAPEIWTGSHLDSVPDGGRFDGPLGVLVGLEAVAERRAEPRRATLCVVAFRDEEGWRFSSGFFGSTAASGQLEPRHLTATDAEGISVIQALGELGLPAEPSAVRLPGSFVEAHIEQGPVLARADHSVGLVSGLAGMRGYTVELCGQAGHAGTLPMTDRSDAFAAAAAFSLRLYDAARALPSAVATIGDVQIANPASNVVPGRVVLTVDVRALEQGSLESLCGSVAALARQEAERGGCTSHVTDTGGGPPTAFSPRVRSAIRSAAQAGRIPILELPTGAGHDAGVLARAGVASGMIFVRSLNGGVSHRPEELSSQADIQDAIELLAGTLAALEGEGR